VTASIAVTTLLSALIPAWPAAARSAAAPHPRGQRITVTTTTCAPRWRAPNPGRDRFRIANNSRYAATVYLFHPVSGRIVATAKNVRPHRVREMVVRLKGGGHYIWGCDLRGRPPRVSDAETVPLDPTHGGAGPPVVPLTRDQLVPAMKAYRAYVSHQLGVLATQTATLSADLAADEPSAAETAWLAAHETWLRIGQDDGPYSAFGRLGARIDGTTAGLVHGTSDPAFTGFHKIEWDLWTKNDVGAAAHDTTALIASLNRVSSQGIATWLPLSRNGVGGLPLRCHEILEDALRDSLTGEDDYGSGTDFASVRADVAGTRELLGLLAPVLAPRAAHLAAHARSRLDGLVAAVDATRTHGQWVAVAAVTRRKRERVDSRIGAALEVLSRVPDLLAIGKS
jgi:high-affinity iron transporter